MIITREEGIQRGQKMSRLVKKGKNREKISVLPRGFSKKILIYSECVLI